MRRAWLVPLTGVLFLVLLVAGFLIGGEPPSVDDHSAQEIVNRYVDDKDSIEVAAYLVGLAAIVLVFFANHLRNVFRASPTSATILVGAGIVAVSAGIDDTVQVVLAESADDIDPTAVQALQAFWDNDFVPVAIGLVVFLVSLAVAMFQTRLVPKWLAWVTVVIAVIAITPIGFIAFPLTGLLIIVLSILLALRARTTAAPPPPAAPPPATA